MILPSLQSKIFEFRWSELKAELESMQNTRIGFTNGCFDVIHVGHIGSLIQAKSECDFLIVAINSDDSVKRLKGETRPIHTSSARASVLAALEVVDAVVYFNEDTPFELIKCLQPNVLLKGGDYTIDQIVGADIVQSNGGKVIIFPIIDGYSSSRAIALGDSKSE